MSSLERCPVPAGGALSALLLVPSGPLLAHLRAALAAHLRQCRRDGIEVPAELAAFLAACCGQQRPNVAGDGTDPHAVAVSYEGAARRLGVSARTVRRMAHDGRLARVRAGRRVLVPVAALRAYTDGRAA